jgi:hypothetical protein
MQHQNPENIEETAWLTDCPSRLYNSIAIRIAIFSGV